ncbi:MAG: hypothetical protein HUK13_00980 [Muribaculaceae bacterium]|nr:hypothetical protein [Muribaculaceae bacterium]
MTQYKGKTATIQHPQADVYARLSDLRNFQAQLETLPEEARAKIGDIRFTEDSIVITAQPVGEIVLRATRREEPSLLAFDTENSPVPLGIELHLEADGEAATTLQPVITVDLPPMLRPFVGPKLQEAADKMGMTISTLMNQ